MNSSLNLTTEEKKALVKILIEIMHADRVVKEKEVNYLKEVRKNIDISDVEYEEASNLNVLACLTTLRGLNLPDKQEVREMMKTMIMIDGDIDKREMDLFKVVCSGADIKI